ncbi:MAG TPA: RDD family protein [Candidatus Dormibacteraeota bacterium]|nr:RDD family protein [Candidatus Dormibacteraeota bacterium]
MRWDSGHVSVEDSVPTSTQLGGDVLRTSFLPSIQAVTFGLIRARDHSLVLGPLRLLRFGPPKVTRHAVSWPIEGGLLTASAGGWLTVQSSARELKATVEDYRPMLPLGMYRATQLRLHHALVRIQLLRLAEHEAPGVPASLRSRAAAGAVDVALCAGLALVARRRRLRVLATVLAAYHVACWTSSGRTLGGRLLGQRVVSLDGSGVSLMQAALRFAALPLALVHRRPVHDDIAATTVLQDPN